MSSNPYNSPMAGGPMGGNVEPHRGTTVLILGILSLICCGPIGIAAWLMGSADLKKMQAGQMDRSGESTTNIGKILGIVGVVLWVLVFIGNIVVMAIGGGAAALNN